MDAEPVFPWWYKWVAVGLVVLLLGVLGAFVMVREGQISSGQREIRRVQQQTLCIARLQSAFEAAVGSALSAPPAPNPAREFASKAIQRSADQLSQAAKRCP